VPVEVITRGERRRAWAPDQKREIVMESLGPELTLTEVARKHGIGSKREPTPTFRRGPQLTRFAALVGGVGADVGERGVIRGA